MIDHSQRVNDLVLIHHIFVQLVVEQIQPEIALSRIAKLLRFLIDILLSGKVGRHR